MRFGPRAPLMVQVLKEKGLTGARLGTIGTLGGPNLLPYGWTPQPMWAYLTQALPDAKVRRALDDFSLPSGWLKADEELALYRYASQISEQACQVMLDVTRPGVPETEIFSAVMHEFHRNAVGMAHDLFVHSGPANHQLGCAAVAVSRAKPRVVEEGDVVMSEMMPVVGGVEAQAQMCNRRRQGRRAVSCVQPRCARILRSRDQDDAGGDHVW
jgi:Xaa-Pro aminopeptidase